MTTGDWGLLLMLTSASINIALGVDLVRRRRRIAVEYAAAKDRMEALVRSMLPAVGVCWMLVEDPHVPEPWRRQAKQAIPEGVTVTKTPMTSGDTPWAPDTLH